jgi:ubiquinone/menaquinone biosynthesis C-methylase UbiE
MENFQLPIDLHKDGERQGPGGATETELALRLAGLSDLSYLKMADIGCGTGASTRLLARKLDAHITAIDFLPEFLDILKEKAAEDGSAQKIETLAASMDELPFADASLDAIWAEGAIYNIGFVRGINDWKKFLKPGGVLAVSELTWLTSHRPEELQRHWASEYPEVATASIKLGQLEEAGYKPLGYFPLPQECWLENYYRPMQSRFEGFLKRHGNIDEAQKIVEAEQAEIDLYERYSDHVSYGFYVAERLP